MKKQKTSTPFLATTYLHSTPPVSAEVVAEKDYHRRLLWVTVGAGVVATLVSIAIIRSSELPVQVLGCEIPTVTVSAEGSLSSVGQSAPVAFSIQLQSVSSVALENASIRARVYRLGSSGPEGVSDEAVESGIRLAPAGQGTYTYVWNAAPDQPPGEYRVEFSVLEGRFPILTAANGPTFTVIGESVGTVGFVPDSLTINGQESIGRDVLLPEDVGTVAAAASIRNTGMLDQVVNVTWTTYAESDLSTPIDSKTVPVVARAKEATPVTYELPGGAHGALRFVASFTSGQGSASRIEGAAVRVGAPQIVFAGATKEGSIVCAHTVGTASGTYTLEFAEKRFMIPGSRATITAFGPGTIGYVMPQQRISAHINRNDETLDSVTVGRGFWGL